MRAVLLAGVVAGSLALAGCGSSSGGGSSFSDGDRLFDCRVDGNARCGSDVIVRGACVTYADRSGVCRWGSTRVAVPWHAPTGGK